MAGFIFPHPDTPKNAPDFTHPNKDTPKTHPILDPNLRRRIFRGVCFCAPTRVRAKFNGFHIPAHIPAKNAPHFIIPNKDSTKNPPGFRPKPSARIVSGPMQYAPARVREKPARFHISTHVPTKNPPGFIFPHTYPPKTRRVLDPNLWRGTFRGVCNTPLHGYTKKIVWFHISAPEYAKNAPDFRPKSLAQDISRRMLLRPTRVHTKFGGFHTSLHG